MTKNMTHAQARRMVTSAAIRKLNQLHAENRARIAAGLKPLDPLGPLPDMGAIKPEPKRETAPMQQPPKPRGRKSKRPSGPVRSEIYEIDALFPEPTEVIEAEPVSPGVLVDHDMSELLRH